MSSSPGEQRQKKQTTMPASTRYLLIGIAALAIGIAVYLAAGGRLTGDAKRGPKESFTSARTALGKLYAEAEKDLKNKKLLAAAVKFKQLANMDPNYKDAAQRAKAVAGQLLDEAVKDINAGDYDAAKEKLDTAKQVDPTNKKVDQKLKEIDDKTGGDSSPTPNGDGPPPPAGDTPRPIPADATPVSLLFSEIAGYETVQNGWLDKPVEAGSSYISSSPEVRAQIERVLVKIVKFATKEAATNKLKEIKGSWPNDQEDMTINGHSAFSGVYDFGKADDFFKFRQMAIIAWTRDNWFFMVEALPKGTPDSAYKKGIARDVAIKIGY